MKNMNDFWHYPKIKEDKAEYKRMRREWKELQQRNNGSSKSDDFKKGSKAKLVVCLCSIFVFASLLFNNGEALKFVFLKNDINVSAPGLRLDIGKSVSYKTNSYLEQADICILKWNELVSLMNNNIVNVDFNTYFDEMDILLKGIELLNEKSISRFDNLKSYETVCEAYFGCIYSFFTSVKEQHFLSFDAYNRFLVELNSLENPYNHLIELFDEHGYYYYTDSDKKVHYKVNNSFFQ